ncbi:MAG: taurine dioxygenase, partial [Rhodospirillaceae bacterium]|nr:taurine dioxygenase [Rhodospirillaceae bacterium]
MTAQVIQATPVAGALGADIAGVDLSKDLDNESFDAIHQALLDHCVIFFKDQDITPEQQLDFAKRFGGIHHHPYMQGMPNHPDIFEILKTETDPHNFGGVWHVDQMFTPKPNMATILYAKEVPEAGGDTLFANMYNAYDALSDTMKDMLSGLKVLCVGDRPGKRSRKERYKELNGVKMNEEDIGVRASEHPLIRSHPETGRKSLFIGSHVDNIAGMTKGESEPILGFLRQ